MMLRSEFGIPGGRGTLDVELAR